MRAKAIGQDSLFWELSLGEMWDMRETTTPAPYRGQLGRRGGVCAAPAIPLTYGGSLQSLEIHGEEESHVQPVEDPHSAGDCSQSSL